MNKNSMEDIHGEEKVGDQILGSEVEGGDRRNAKRILRNMKDIQYFSVELVDTSNEEIVDPFLEVATSTYIRLVPVIPVADDIQSPSVAESAALDDLDELGLKFKIGCSIKELEEMPYVVFDPCSHQIEALQSAYASAELAEQDVTPKRSCSKDIKATSYVRMVPFLPDIEDGEYPNLKMNAIMPFIRLHEKPKSDRGGVIYLESKKVKSYVCEDCKKKFEN